MIAGFDCDGVLSGFSQLMQKDLGLDPEKLTSWSYKEAYGKEVDREVYRRLMLPETWIRQEPLPGAKDALALLTDEAIPWVIVTSMPEKFRGLRDWWFREHFGGLVEHNERTLERLGFQGYLSIVERAEQKPSVCHSIGITYFVEDKPSTAELLARSGIVSYLVPSTYMGSPTPNVVVAPVTKYARDVFVAQVGEDMGKVTDIVAHMERRRA